MPSTTAELEAKPTETTTPPAAQEAVKTPEAAKAPPLNMLKILGYAAEAEADPAKLPDEPPAETPKAEAPAAETSAASTPEGEAKPGEEQPRVKKKAKPSALDKLPPDQPRQEQAPEPVKAPEPSEIEAAVDLALKKAQIKPDNAIELAPEDKKVIELAEYAAKIDPAKYGDLAKKELDFIATRNAHISEWVKENGVAADSPEFADYLSSPEYRNFVRAHRPAVSQIERESLKERMIEDRALARARAEQAKQRDEFDRKLKGMELRPVIDAAALEAEAAILDIDDDAVREFKADPAAALEANPIEAPIIHEFATKSRNLTTEYLRIAEGLVDASADNPLHVELDNFIAQRGQQLDALPEDKRTRNGRVLISPARYREMAAKHDPAINRYETFSKRDVANLIRETHKVATSAVLQQRREAMGKAGYVRNRPNGQGQQAAKPAEQAPARVDSPSPKAVSTRAPGPSSKPAGPAVSMAAKALGYA